MRMLKWTALVLAAASPALAEDGPITWKDDVGGWYIGVDTSIGNGCFMTAAYEAGTYLRVQFNPSADTFQFIIGDEAWNSIEQGKLYTVGIAFGNRDPWTGDAEGGRLGELPTLTVDVGFEKNKAATFIDEFRRMTSVAVTYENKEIARLTLSGTNAAMQEVINCQTEVNEAGAAAPAQAEDPFNSGASTDSDPFN
ncbi:hypothetical protein L0V05_09935 [Tabrizicola sp. J26]|uniref:hypothetical protein n=1 Tax=Alitabrizicola rongguiensis TaxID=2909234 RepID=UPI001F25FBC9|nr:hypothetical protein [Tabrizicola rongguiensis]MCF1709135.1 hypothetical protein [Tabrizicola rongguiensis]